MPNPVSIIDKMDEDCLYLFFEFVLHFESGFDYTGPLRGKCDKMLVSRPSKSHLYR